MRKKSLNSICKNIKSFKLKKKSPKSYSRDHCSIGKKVGTVIKPITPFNMNNSKSVTAPLVPSNFKKKPVKVAVKPPTK